MDATQDLHTRLQHTEFGYDGGAVTPPIFQTSTYCLETPEQGAELASAVRPDRFYTRYGSPNAAHAARLVALTEAGQDALVVGSGMAAITAVLMSHLQAGDQIVAQSAHYTGTLSMLGTWLPRFGIEVSQVDQTDPEAFTSACTDRTKMIYTETPTNPTMALTDLSAVAEGARERGALSVCDNTFASGYCQRPLEHGIDVVVHSATKFLNGHHDVTAGAVVGATETVDRVWEWARVTGPLLHPFEAWLLARGLKTFALRLQRQTETALHLARWLDQDERVARAHYPGLDSHPQHELAKRQMAGAFGAMLAFELPGAPAEARAAGVEVLRRLELCTPAVSLGGTETLLTHPASQIYAHQSEEELAEAGIGAGLLRMSVGAEHPDDLLADLDRALG